MSGTPPNDGLIISAVLAGDVPQFEELVNRYRRPLLRVAYSRIGCHDAADDVVQDTFVCAFKSLASYDSRFSFRTWLWTILLNQCRRHYHQRKKRQAVVGAPTIGADSAAMDLVSQEASPSSAMIQREQQEILCEMLYRLPEPQADALRLRFYGGLKFHEIADAMGCSLSTAKNRVRWGLEKMSGLLNGLAERSPSSGYSNVRRGGVRE